VALGRRESFDLGTLPGGDFSQALGNNDAGDIVGISTSTGGSRAVLWTSRAGIQDLNTLIPPSPFVLTQAVGINNVGMIIAMGHDLDPHAGHGHSHESHETARSRVSAAAFGRPAMIVKTNRTRALLTALAGLLIALLPELLERRPTNWPVDAFGGPAVLPGSQPSAAQRQGDDVAGATRGFRAMTHACGIP
jgi:hypothetical protein